MAEVNGGPDLGMTGEGKRFEGLVRRWGGKARPSDRVSANSACRAEEIAPCGVRNSDEARANVLDSLRQVACKVGVNEVVFLSDPARRDSASECNVIRADLGTAECARRRLDEATDAK